MRWISYPSAVDSNTTRMPPPAAFARSTISCRVRCKFVGSKSTVLAIMNSYSQKLWCVSIDVLLALIIGMCKACVVNVKRIWKWSCPLSQVGSRSYFWGQTSFSSIGPTGIRGNQLFGNKSIRLDRVEWRFRNENEWSWVLFWDFFVFLLISRSGSNRESSCIVLGPVLSNIWGNLQLSNFEFSYCSQSNSVELQSSWVSLEH